MAKEGKRGRGLFIVGGILAVLVVCAIGIAVLPGSEREKPASAAATSRATRTPKPTETPTLTSAQYKEELQAQALANVTYDDLNRYSENYEGKIVYYKGKIVQSVEGWGSTYTLRINVTQGKYGLWEDTIWVNWKGGDERLLEDDIVHLWGRVMGRKSYKAVLGNQITIPEVDGLYMERIPEGADDFSPVAKAKEEGEPTDTPAPTAEVKATHTPEPPEEPTATPEPTRPPKLGDVVMGDGCFIAAIQVEDPALPGMFYEKKEGKKLVAVELVVGNVAKPILGTNPLDAALIDADGFVYSVELAGREGQFPCVDLHRGEKARGWVAFEIPQEALPHGVKYALGTFSGKYLQGGLEQEGPVSLEAIAAVADLAAAAPLGQADEQHGYSLTAVQVEDPALPGMFYEPRPGTKLVAVEIIVGNVDAEPLSTNPLYTILVDAQGFVYTAELGGRDSQQDGQLDCIDLNKGEKVRGWIAFEVPSDAILHSLKYQVELFEDRYLRAGLAQ